MKNKKTLLPLLTIFFCSLPFLAASAAVPQDENITLATSDGENVYAVGVFREFNDAIPDDLYAAGQTLDITGRVGGDLGAAAGKIEVTAPIGDDVRLAGQFITISSPDIGGSVLVFGQNIVFRNMSKVNGDAWVYGAFVELRGAITGNVKVGAEQVVIDGPITGDVEIEANRVTFGENGFVSGKLTLKASETVPKEKVGGEIAFTQLDRSVNDQNMLIEQAKLLWTPIAIIMLVSTLLIGLLFLAIFKNFGIVFANTVKDNVFISMGIGFLTLIAVPFLIIFLMVTLIGIPLSFLILFLYIACLIFTSLIDGLVIGAFLFPLKKTVSFWHLYGAFAVGTFVTFLLGIIPYFGPVIKFLIFVAAMGALLQVKYDLVTLLRKTKKI